MAVQATWPALVLAFALATGPARADLGSESQVNLDVTNPLGKSWLLKIQSNTTWLEVRSADTTRLEETAQLEPRLSFPLTDALLLVTRPKIRLFRSRPVRGDAGSLARAEGFGDTELPLAVTPDLGPHWLVGVGPSFVLPTASSDEIGKGKWQAGPASVMGWKSKRWQAALFLQQHWSFAGWGDDPVSKLEAQYFLTRFLPNGWNVGMSPTIEVDWKAAPGQQLTVPVGLGVGKVLKLSSGLAVKVGVQLEYMPIYPDEFGKRANIQVTIEPVWPQPFTRPLLGR